MPELTFGVSLTTDKAIYAAGESIVMELIVFNRTSKNLTFDFRDAQHYDFIIDDTEGNSVWRWAEGRMFAQVSVRRPSGQAERRWYTPRPMPGRSSLEAIKSSVLSSLPTGRCRGALTIRIE